MTEYAIKSGSTTLATFEADNPTEPVIAGEVVALLSIAVGVSVYVYETDNGWRVEYDGNIVTVEPV